MRSVGPRTLLIIGLILNKEESGEDMQFVDSLWVLMRLYRTGQECTVGDVCAFDVALLELQMSASCTAVSHENAMEYCLFRQVRQSATDELRSKTSKPYKGFQLLSVQCEERRFLPVA